MFKSAERKRSHGFTLAEVLIVVAIIGILLAVAIPNVISYYRSLKLTELDDSAKTIFMAAQSRLTAMTSAGQDLYALSDIYVDETAGPNTSTGKYLAVTDAKPDRLASLVPGGSIESQLYDNHYVVEIDPKTGAVYAVWYWEKEDFKYTNDAYVKVPSDKGERLKKGAMVGYYGGSEINRPDLGQMPIPQLTVINAEELRLEIRIPTVKLPTGSNFSSNNIRVKVLVNGTEIISDTELMDSVDDNFTSKNRVGKVILDTLKSGYNKIPDRDAAGSGWLEGWVAGAKFEDWVKDNDIVAVPGDDINVTVVVSYLGTVKIKGKDTSLVSQSASVRTNSLFASVKDDGTDKVAEIAYGRHLQNLDTSTSGVNETSTTITAAVQTRSIDFNDNTSVKDVYSWADTYGNKMFKPIENASLTSYNGHEYEIRNLNIQNVSNDPYAYLGLFGLLTKTNLDDTIKFENTILVNTESEEGFVVGALVGGLLANGNINNCHVYLDEIGADGKLRDLNPRLKGSSVGGLVGMAFEDLTMINCSAATVISGTGNVGGLVSGVIGVCKISKSYAACNITGAYVGGLVGNGPGGVTIQNSYAAGTADVIDDASKARKVAGLVNWSDDVTQGALPPTLTNSYAAVRYGKSVTDARASNSLEDFFGACEITPDMTASSKVSDLYYVKQAGITYEGNSGVALSMSTLKGKIGTVPFDSDEWYNPGTGVTVNPQGLTVPYNMIDGIKLNDPYPYPMLASSITAVDGTPIPMPHYGDWLEGFEAILAYYEKYVDNTYGFYSARVSPDGADTKSECVLDTLKNGTGTLVAEDGYCLLIPTGIDAAAVSDPTGSLTLAATADTTLSVAARSIAGPVTDAYGNAIDLNNYSAYPLTAAPASTSSPMYYEFSIDGGAQTFYINPYFGLEAFDVTPVAESLTGAATLESVLPQSWDSNSNNIINKPLDQEIVLPDSPTSTLKNVDKYMAIRSPRQLANLAACTETSYTSETAGDGNFIQLLNIDYALYTGAGFETGKTGSNRQGPASLSNSSHYDGHGFFIRNLYLGGTNNVGLFGNTGCYLTGIRLVNVNVTGNENVGALAGHYSGNKILDCGVYVDNANKPSGVTGNAYDEFTVTGETNVGGLIGDLKQDTGIADETVENCFASVKVSGEENVGGFIGLTDGDGYFVNCYSGGHTGYTDTATGKYVGGKYDPNNANVTATTGPAGGFIGACSGSGSYKFQGVFYSTCSVTSTSGNAGQFVGKIDNTNLESALNDTDVTVYALGKVLGRTRNVETYLKTPAVNDKTTFTTHPYDTELYEKTAAGNPDLTKPLKYPDLSGLNEHYGDWPLINASATYVEIYKDDITGDETYGLYGYLSDTNTQINTLKTDLTGVSLIDDCYGLLVPDGDPCPDVIPVNDGTLEPKKDASGDPIVYRNVPTDNTGVTSGYDLYRYDFVPTPGVTSTGYYHSVTLNKQEFWVNLDYGCEVVKAPAGVTVTTAKPQSKPGAAGFVSGTTPDPDEYDNKVVIRTARQLANMAAATGSEALDDDESKFNLAQLRKYEQLLNIDYSQYTGADLNVGKDDANAQTPAALCRRKGHNDETGGYNGNGFFIKNLHIKAEDGTSKNVGLFGELGTSAQSKIEKITLINVKVNGGNCANVGALAGYVTNSTILENCGVYVEKVTDYGTFTVEGGNYVGGLVGILGSNTQATNCFAAVKVTGKDAVGGFVGQMNGSKGIGNCYSGGHTDGGEYKNDSINVTATDGTAGGFVGKLLNYQNKLKDENDPSQGIQSRDYKAFKVVENSVLYSTCSVSGTTIGLFAGEVSEAFEQTDPEVNPAKDSAGNDLPIEKIEPELSKITNYGLGTAFKKDGTGYTPTTPRGETYLTKPTVTAKGSGFKTHPYDLPTLEGKDYPYQTNLNEHYGDWVMPKFQVSGFLYWEKEGSVYNYSVTAWQKKKDATDWTGLTIDPTLCNEYDQENIEDYGYGWFYAGDFDGNDPTMTGAAAAPDNAAANALKNSLKTALETALPGVDLGTVTVEAYSYNSTNASGTTQTWTIRHGTETLQTATLNPDFADTVTTDGTVATPYKVRTIRQLRNINHTAYLAQSFTQGHDLDGDGVTDYAPIGNGTGDFTGHYDGKGYRIRNLDISVAGEDACAGLFGRASGSANFERIIMWGNNNTISASDSSGTLIKNSRARVGGIVAEIPSGSVTISNCVVAGYRLEASATGNIFCTSENVYVGGIVANLNGTVENCEAVVNITNNSGSAYIGGLVGEIGSGSVTNSYAGGSVTTSDTTCVGGLVGKAASDNQITNSFSYVTGAHYAIDGNGRTHNSCAYFGDTFANNRDNDAQQCASVTALTNWLISNATFHYAEYVYDGSGEVSGATFNGAVVEVPGPDGDPVYVHYGDLPA